MNELGLCPTISNNVYFANNEQPSLGFTDVFCLAHAEHNLIKLKLYINWSTQAVNNSSESAMWNSKQTNQIHHFQTLANQSTLNKAHVIEITKACTVTFMKARNSFVNRCGEKHVNWEKKQKMVKIYFLKC